MEETEVLIVGQGLAGHWLSYWLYKKGISFKVIDQPKPDGASLRAAGLINPVTGRRLVTTWMIDELLPFSLHAYQEIGKLINRKVIEETSLVDFFPSVQMMQAFQKRFEEDPSYLFPGTEREKYAQWFRYDLGWGEIKPCLLVNAEMLLTSWREWLKARNYMLELVFDQSDLKLKENRLIFSDVSARYIVFCDGKSSVQSPYFDKLPFALNKGEGLLVEINDLPANRAYKKGMSLIPYRENIFWLGSSYEWSFYDDQPSEKFRKSAEDWIKNFIKKPYRILEHFAALRPATLERRPFVGFHPRFPQIGIMNGLGTKGCSLAPYFARELAEYLGDGKEINPLADIRRFAKILSR